MVFGISSAVHLALIGGVLLIPRSSPAGQDLFKERVIVTRLVKLGREADEKLLPRLNRSPFDADSATGAAVDTGREKVEKHPEEEDAERQKDLAKKIASSVSRMKKMIEKSSSRGEPGTGRPEGSPFGDSDTAREGDVYLTTIHNYIRNNYVVPSILSETEKSTLRATIIIYLDPSGRLIKLTFEKRSGNPHFDNSLESAVKKSSPFPPPPKEKARLFQDQGIGINFSI